MSIKFKVGDKVKVVYDARPLVPLRIYDGFVTHITKGGLLRIKSPEHNELYDPFTGACRGWKTLHFDLTDELVARVE